MNPTSEERQMWGLCYNIGQRLPVFAPNSAPRTCHWPNIVMGRVWSAEYGRREVFSAVTAVETDFLLPLYVLLHKFQEE